MIAPVEMPLSPDPAAELLAAAPSDDAEADAVRILVMTLTSPPASVVTVVTLQVSLGLDKRTVDKTAA
jgi:hypothetical protein